MARSKKPRSLLDKDEPVLQLTSHQRIVAISMILLWGAFCFVLGIVASNVDRWLRERRVSAAEQIEESAPILERTEQVAERPLAERTVTGAKSSGEGRVTSPRQGVLDSATPSSTGVSKAPTAPTRASAQATPKTVPKVSLPVKVPAPPPAETPAQSEKAPPKPEEPPAEQKPSPSKPEAASTEQAQTSPAKPTAAAIEPIEPMEPARPGPVAPPNEKKETKESAKPAPSTAPSSTATPSGQPRSADGGQSNETKPAPGGGFAVQVASFSVANSAKAEVHRKEVAAATGLDARLVKSEDGKHVRVLVGAYRTRAEATKARDALRKRKEFAGCYVQTLR